MPDNSLVPAEANSPSAAAEPEGSDLAALGSVPSQDPGAEDKLQVGLAVPPGGPGSSCSASVTSEPSLASGETQKTHSLIFSLRM